MDLYLKGQKTRLVPSLAAMEATVPASFEAVLNQVEVVVVVVVFCPCATLWPNIATVLRLKVWT